LTTSLSFSEGSSKTHLSLESMRSSGLDSFHCITFVNTNRILTNESMSETFGGAKMVCTMNLCLLFSLGSYSKGCSITAKRNGTSVREA
uniref:Uncharacterized protein n=1 Tax=Oryzias melastigma TaxID=30732 RepID=A0A3B3CNW0_ORYME